MANYISDFINLWKFAEVPAFHSLIVKAQTEKCTAKLGWG